MGEAFKSIWEGIAGSSGLDLINLVLGVIGVALMVRRSLWAFPVGLAAVTVQGVLFYRTRFYADATLQVLFFGTLAWGWWHWRRPTGQELPVTRLTGRERIVTLALVVVGTVIWALAARRWTNAIMPWRDAGIAALQVAGQVLQARKQIENWALFTAANLIAIPAYLSAELAFTAFLFGIYLVLGLLAGVVEGYAGPKSERMSRVKRVVISGTESTGKTWLAQRLAAHFGEPWSPEHAREFWDAHGGITAADLDALDRGQVANEERAAAQARRVVFFDTDLITCVLWNDLLFPGQAPAWVKPEAERRARENALYLLCDADVPFVADPQRCFPEAEDRERSRRLWREALVGRGLPVVEISGDWAAREATAIAAVERLLGGI